MTVLEFNRDFVEYENKLREEKNMTLKTMKPGYKAREAAKGVGIAIIGFAAVFALIMIGCIFA
jgi:hypothetical protein